MRRWIMLVGAMALVAAACSGGEAAETVSSSSVATTEAASPGTTATTASEAPADDATTSTAAPAESAPPPPVDAPPAPDFTLALDDGSEFVLSDEQKPVYVVFWAEW
jgi:hypothetical protein